MGLSDRKAWVEDKKSWVDVPLDTFEKREVIFSLCVCERVFVEGLKQNFVLLYLIEEKSFGTENLGDCSLC